MNEHSQEIEGRTYSNLEKSVISTLVYHDALGEYPLTVFEAYKYLNKIENYTARGYPNFLDILNALENLKKLEIIESKNGFYFLNTNKDLAAQRIERQKITEKKWKRLKRCVRFFYLLPFIKMVAASGSLALNNAKKESDLDLLIITKKGRIWTARITCSFLTHVMGIRRYNNKIKDRICLNYYLAHDSLELKLKNISNAYTYAQIIPLIGKSWWRRFQKSNFWIKNYLNFYPFETAYYFRVLPNSKFLKTISRAMEIMLSIKIGDALEAKLKKWQKEKVLKKVLREEIDEKHILLSDSALMFHHPISRNVEVEKKYAENITKVIEKF